MATPPRIRLKSGREGSLRRGHPWVFSGAIAEIVGAPKAGDVVELVSASGEPLGVGHFGDGSIAVKVLSSVPTAIDSTFFEKRFQSAYELRRRLALVENDQTNAFRLVNAEGDGLPGLVIDLYDQTAVVQCHSLGMSQHNALISGALRSVVTPSLEIVERHPVDRSEDESSDDEASQQQQLTTVIRENGVQFIVDCARGQKTGFYLDQRDNRMLLRSFVAGKSVLNAFSYSGGFSVSAMAGGARSVESVDASKEAIALARRNVELNNRGRDVESTFLVADCFDYLRSIKNRFDVIVLDPPAFAKHRKAVARALRGYETINALAIASIRPGGVLFTFSCSQLVSREQFAETVRRGASQSGRNVRVLQHLSAAPCHPVNLAHPEGEYLKGLVLAVD